MILLESATVCSFPEKFTVLVFRHWPGMTIWPQLHKEVSNAEKQLLLVDIAMFSWIKTNGLEKQILSNNSANVYFHLQTSGSMSHIHIPFSKSRLFPCHFKHSHWCLSYLSTRRLAALVSSDIPPQLFHKTPQREARPAASNLFLLPLSPRATLQLQRESITPTENCCSVSARQRRTLKWGWWTTGYETWAVSRLRWITGRHCFFAVKHVSYPWREQGWPYGWSCPIQEYCLKK